MANIAKLNYTIDEINEKLEKIDEVVQTTGDSETKVMSQKATTDAIKSLGFEVDENTFVPPNILEGLTLTKTVGASINGSGDVVTTQYSGNYTAINEKIDVVAGCTYKFPKFFGVARYFYSNGTVSEQILIQSGNAPEDHEITIPDSVTHIRIAYAHTVCNFTGEIYRLTMTTEEKKSLPTVSECLQVLPQNIQREDTKEFIRGLMPDAPFEADESAFVPPNILEGLSIEYVKGSSWNNSGLATTQYTGNYTAVTPCIDVIEGHTYKIPKFYGVVLLYDANGVNGTQLARTEYPLGDFEFTIPEGKAKIGIAYVHNNVPAVDKVYRLTMTTEEENVLPVKNDNLSIQKANIKSVEIISLLAPLKDKVIVNFGDSIFGNARPPEDISTRLAELTGATVHNCGFGGCRMASHPSANYDAFSMTKLADAIVSRDFSLQENAATSTSGDTVPAYFAVGLATLKSVDFTKADIITIAYGANDFNGIVLDDATKTSFAGALRYSVETILNAYPHLKIFVCSPTYRFWMDSTGAFTEDTDTKKGGYGYTTLELWEKAKAVAAEYKLPFIDNYNIGINKFNRGYYFPVNDGAHHKLNGRKLIAEHIAKELF